MSCLHHISPSLTCSVCGKEHPPEHWIRWWKTGAVEFRGKRYCNVACLEADLMLTHHKHEAVIWSKETYENTDTSYSNAQTRQRESAANSEQEDEASPPH